MGRGGARQGAGRKMGAEQRRVTRAVRFSPGEWLQVKEYARQEGVVVSEYVRRASLKKLKEE